MGTEKCDREVYAHGTAVMVTHSISPEQFEHWVSLVAAISGQRVDWHCMGGKDVVRAIGDLAAVEAAIDLLLPAHDALYGRVSDGPPPRWFPNRDQRNRT